MVINGLWYSYLNDKFITQQPLKVCMGLGNPAKAETPERLLDITILAPSFMGPPLRFLDRGHWNEMVMLCERHFYFFYFSPILGATSCAKWLWTLHTLENWNFGLRIRQYDPNIWKLHEKYVNWPICISWKKKKLFSCPIYIFAWWLLISCSKQVSDLLSHNPACCDYRLGLDPILLKLSITG